MYQRDNRKDQRNCTDPSDTLGEHQCSLRRINGSDSPHFGNAQILTQIKTPRGCLGHCIQ